MGRYSECLKKLDQALEIEKDRRNLLWGYLPAKLMALHIKGECLFCSCEDADIRQYKNAISIITEAQQGYEKHGMEAGIAATRISITKIKDAINYSVQKEKSH